MTKLTILPCPFCGISTGLTVSEDKSEEDGTVYAHHVVCGNCGSKGGNRFPISWCETEEQAIDRWNQRDAIIDPSVESKNMLNEFERRLNIANYSIKQIVTEMRRDIDKKKWKREKCSCGATRQRNIYKKR